MFFLHPLANTSICVLMRRSSYPSFNVLSNPLAIAAVSSFFARNLARQNFQFAKMCVAAQKGRPTVRQFPVRTQPICSLKDAFSKNRKLEEKRKEKGKRLTTRNCFFRYVSTLELDRLCLLYNCKHLKEEVHLA